MNKTLKTVLLCLVAVLVIGRIALGPIAARVIRSQLSAIPGANVEVGKVRIALIPGRLSLRDIAFSLSDSTGLQADGRIEALKLKRIGWLGLLREKVSIGEVRIEKGSANLVNSGNAMKASVKEVSVGVHGIGLQLKDGSFEYCDSLYSASLDSLDYTDATGLNRIQVGHLSTADAGEVLAQGLRFYNCVPKEKLAERMGKVSSMWYDAKLDSLYISAVNIPRMVKNQDYQIDSVHFSAPEIVLFQDDRYPPAVPYPTFQESLNAAKIPLAIRRIDAGIKVFTFQWETQPGKMGSVPMYNLHMVISSASNAPGNVMELSAYGARKGRCSGSFYLSVKNDKAESTRGKLQVKNLDLSSLDGFVGPLYGATAAGNVHSIDCSFKGNKQKMQADFCMQYENLSAKVLESGVLSFIGNAVLPKANPSKPGAEPKAVSYSFERDSMKPYPSYLIQSLTMGMLHTILPGGKKKK